MFLFVYYIFIQACLCVFERKRDYSVCVFFYKWTRQDHNTAAHSFIFFSSLFHVLTFAGWVTHDSILFHWFQLSYKIWRETAPLGAWPQIPQRHKQGHTLFAFLSRTARWICKPLLHCKDLAEQAREGSTQALAVTLSVCVCGFGMTFLWLVVVVKISDRTT